MTTPSHRKISPGRAAAVALTLTLARSSAAEPAAGGAEVQAARQLFAEAARDESAGRWAQAREKFVRIIAIKETPAGRFHKALCEEKLGRVLAAYDDYKRAAELAEASPPSKDRRLILDESASTMAALLPRLPTVTIKAPAQVPALVVRLDGQELTPPELGGARRVELGDHVVEATAPRHAAYRFMFRSSEGANDVVDVKLEREPLPDASPPPLPTSVPAVQPGAATAPVDTTSASGSSKGPWAWVGAGASAALAGVAVWSFLDGRSAQRDLDGPCAQRNVSCDRDGYEAKRDRSFAIAGVAGGLALVGAGATTWWALTPPARSKQGHALAASPAGVTWRFHF